MWEGAWKEEGADGEKGGRKIGKSEVGGGRELEEDEDEEEENKQR